MFACGAVGRAEFLNSNNSEVEEEMAQAAQMPGGISAKVETKEQDSASQLLLEAEPWEKWETKLVGYSIALGLIGLVILGWLVNTFILHA